MKIAEANKELLKAAVLKAGQAWLDSKPKNPSIAQAPPVRGEGPNLGGPDLGTPEVKALSKAVKAYTTYRLLDLSLNPESRRPLIDIWLDDYQHTIIQLDLDKQTIEEY